MYHRKDYDFKRMLKAKGVYEKKRKPVKIGDKEFASIREASSYLQKTPEYIARMIRKNGKLQDGTPINFISRSVYLETKNKDIRPKAIAD